MQDYIRLLQPSVNMFVILELMAGWFMNLLLTLNGALYPRSNTDRYLPCTEGGSWLISIEKCIRQEEHGLSDYVRNKAQEPVIGCLQHLVLEQTASEYKVRRKKEKEEEWRKKALHGQFVTRIEASEDTWGWLKTDPVNKESWKKKQREWY